MPTDDAYRCGMTAVCTVKLSAQTHDRLRARAKREQLTQSALIEAMLDDREDAEFWAALAAAPPPSDAELDEVDAFFVSTADDGIIS
jgi:hypothetical protein